jgi:hypothetical protein
MFAENDENMKSDERTTEKNKSYTNSPKKIVLHNDGTLHHFAKL